MEKLTDMQCVSVGEDTPPLTREQIRAYQSQLPKWYIANVDGIERIEKIFMFNDFIRALDFTNKVGEFAEAENHHPALLTEWGQTTVTWWTHTIRGIHLNDLIMAAKTDTLY